MHTAWIPLFSFPTGSSCMASSGCDTSSISPTQCKFLLPLEPWWVMMWRLCYPLLSVLSVLASRVTNVKLPHFSSNLGPCVSACERGQVLAGMLSLNMYHVLMEGSQAWYLLSHSHPNSIPIYKCFCTWVILQSQSKLNLLPVLWLYTTKCKVSLV